MQNRRNFLTALATSVSALALSSKVSGATKEESAHSKPRFQISLAEWSLHRKLEKGELLHLDFPLYAKEVFGITAVEYVNRFFGDKGKDKNYLTDMKQRCVSEGINSLLIMVDGEGALGAKKEADRADAVERHKKWVEAAAFLGCHTIRVNGYGEGGREEQAKQLGEGMTKLCLFAKDFGLNVVIENHGGLSSDGAWLSGVLRSVDMPNCGSLPDFGNFATYDRYQGIRDLMPYAKGVSAKTNQFDEMGNAVKTDYVKAMKIVLDEFKFRGHIGIEYEGKEIEDIGIRKTHELLKRFQ